MAGGDISLVCIIEDVTFIFWALSSPVFFEHNHKQSLSLKHGWGVGVADVLKEKCLFSSSSQFTTRLYR